jgi:general secretion pathway protein A
MYLSFFGLNEKPFAITPDPRYLFLSERHSEALAHLIYGVAEAGGFIQLTGEVGTGKTTIIRSLLSRTPANSEVALILNPRVNAPEFLLTLCEELGIGVPDSAVSSVKDLVDILSGYLLRAHAAGRRVVLVVDEAQNLALDTLEQIRLLTNLETETQKLLQIILIGQPELKAMLATSQLRPLAQRMTGRYHLAPLSRSESAAYVRHRLRVAGSVYPVFTKGALAELHHRSQGIPRLINIMADRALLGAFALERQTVNTALQRRAASEVLGRRLLPRWLPWVGVALAALVVVLVFWFLRNGSLTSARLTAPPAVAPE